jgi:hypothetical protein
MGATGSGARFQGNPNAISFLEVGDEITGIFTPRDEVRVNSASLPGKNTYNITFRDFERLPLWW